MSSLTSLTYGIRYWPKSVQIVQQGPEYVVAIEERAVKCHGIIMSA